MNEQLEQHISGKDNERDCTTSQDELLHDCNGETTHTKDRHTRTFCNPSSKEWDLK